MSIDLPFWYNVNRQTNISKKEPMLMDIILYLLQLIQQLYQQNIWLINFICKYIPLKQWAFDDSDCKCPRCNAPKIYLYKNNGSKGQILCKVCQNTFHLALWVACYNFLRPHKHNGFKPLVENDMIKNGENMHGKWQLLIFLGQQTILQMQRQACA